MVYLPGMEVYASAGGGSADDQLDGPFYCGGTNYCYCWEYVPKGGGVEFILALPFRMSSVWNGYLNFVHMSRDFLADGRLNVSSSDISYSCFSMMGPDPVFIQW